MAPAASCSDPAWEESHCLAEIVQDEALLSRSARRDKAFE